MALTISPNLPRLAVALCVATAININGTPFPSFGAVMHTNAQQCPALNVVMESVEATVDQLKLRDSMATSLRMSSPAHGPSVEIIALGPILGSMDSREINTVITCTPQGAVLTATVTRSADFHGAVHKNILWRPVITMRAVLGQTAAELRAEWHMRLSTGSVVSHAQTPPYPEQLYPVSAVLPLSKNKRD